MNSENEMRTEIPVVIHAGYDRGRTTAAYPLNVSEEAQPMFDLEKTGKKIREARIAKNMTQMALADEMNVSYQAVSNWERGNTLPDITKLPDLCAILDLDYDELLGDSKGGRAAAKILENKGNEVSLEDLGEAAPLLPADTLEENITIHLNRSEDPQEIKHVLPLLPFLDDDAAEKLARTAAIKDPANLVLFAPFVKSEVLKEMIESMSEPVSLKYLAALAPFLDQDTVDRMAEKAAGEGNTDTDILLLWAPFVSKNVLARIVAGVFSEQTQARE